MNVVLETAVAVQDFCLRQGWEFCFIGGIACQKWSEPRVTDDGDTEGPFIDALLAWLQPRRPDAKEFAERHRVLLLKTESGVGIDNAMGAFPFEQLATQRARDIEMAPGVKLRLCTAEDFIVFKTFAARPLDWRDVEMTIVRQGDAALDGDISVRSSCRCWS